MLVALKVQALTVTDGVAGVFDGHGIQGRNAARVATESILKHLEADLRSDASSLAQEWDRIFEDACVQVCAASLNQLPVCFLSFQFVNMATVYGCRDTSAGRVLRHGLRMMFAQDSQEISPVVQSPKRV